MNEIIRERKGLKEVCEECYCNYPEFTTCEACEHTGFKVIPENQMVYVNVYEVTRHYGGAEEGGWWYDWFKCIEVFPCKNKASEDMVEALEDEHEYKKWGDIYSVLGGKDIRVFIESAPKESESKERPYYE